LPDEDLLWRIAIDKGLAYEDRNGAASLGPLTWIEVGERRYAHSRTVPVGRKGVGSVSVGSRIGSALIFALSSAFYIALVGWPAWSALVEQR